MNFPTARPALAGRGFPGGAGAEQEPPVLLIPPPEKKSGARQLKPRGTRKNPGVAPQNPVFPAIKRGFALKKAQQKRGLRANARNTTHQFTIARNNKKITPPPARGMKPGKLLLCAGGCLPNRHGVGGFTTNECLIIHFWHGRRGHVLSIITKRAAAGISRSAPFPKVKFTIIKKTPTTRKSERAPEPPR